MAKQQTRRWQPLLRGQPNLRFIKMLREAGEQNVDLVEVWSNDVYEVIVRHMPTTGGKGDVLWLSIKRRDRHVIRDWRQLQAIKNEVAGPEREAVEIYPSESRLVDTSNETHLFVLPEGEQLPFGYAKSDLVTPEKVAEFNTEMKKIDPNAGKARQRHWQPGLPTGLGRET